MSFILEFECHVQVPRCLARVSALELLTPLLPPFYLREFNILMSVSWQSVNWDHAYLQLVTPYICNCCSNSRGLKCCSKK
uniref:Uncharacterized protein n=1 Tax=Arundo donax TaxID=35708 RepID=A0A0A9DSX9_ARUDO